MKTSLQIRPNFQGQLRRAKHWSIPFLLARDYSTKPKEQVHEQMTKIGSLIHSTQLRPMAVLGAAGTAMNKVDTDCCPHNSPAGEEQTQR